ncbi:MAG: transporter substrate-binding domain-containing protein [Candidatus Thiodiazotropha sp.]
MSLLWMLFASQVFAQASRFSLAEKEWLDGRQNLKVGVVEMTPPILFFEGGQSMGLAPDYLRALASKLGLYLDLMQFPDQRSLVEALREGEVDFIGAAVYTSAASHDLHFSRPYLNLPAAFYSKGELTSQGLANMEGMDVVVLAGSIWEEILPYYMSGLHTQSAANIEQGLKLVQDDKAQVFLGDAASVNYLLSRGVGKGLHEHPSLDLTLDVALATHSTNPVLHSLLQKAMDRLSDDELHEIWKNWPEVTGAEPKKSGFLMFLLWGLLVAAWSLLLIWIVNRRAKQDLERHRSKTHRSLKRLRYREEVLKQKMQHIKHKAKRYRSRARTLRQQIDFINELLPGATWSWYSKEGEFVWDDGMHEMAGLEKKSVSPNFEEFIKQVNEEDQELVKSLFHDENQSISKISYRFKLPNGGEKHLLQYSHYVIDTSDKGPRRIGICWDIGDYLVDDLISSETPSNQESKQAISSETPLNQESKQVISSETPSNQKSKQVDRAPLPNCEKSSVVQGGDE